MIFAFIIGGMYGILNLTRTNYDTNLASLNLQRQARQGMNWLSREARQAYLSSIVLGASNNDITFNTPDATGVHYSVVNTVVSGKTLWQLKRTDAASTEKIRANDITGLSFSGPNGRILTVTLTASRTLTSFGKTQALTFPLTEEVEIRN